MASCICRSSFFIAFLCLTLLFSDEHTVEGDDNLCEGPSALFEGICLYGFVCDGHCKIYEEAISGHCVDAKCLCTIKCDEKTCARPSGKFSGLCAGFLNSGHCHDLCKEEGGFGGACNYGRCICMQKC